MGSYLTIFPIHVTRPTGTTRTLLPTQLSGKLAQHNMLIRTLFEHTNVTAYHAAFTCLGCENKGKYTIKSEC